MDSLILEIKKTNSIMALLETEEEKNITKELQNCSGKDLWECLPSAKCRVS